MSFVFIVVPDSSIGFILSLYIKYQTSKKYKPNPRNIKPVISKLLEDGCPKKNLLAYIISEQYTYSSAYRLISEECFHTRNTKDIIDILTILSMT